MLDNLFESNRRWASEVLEGDPDFFRRQSTGQSPSYLWLGCSDSRVPAAQVLGLMPGDVFVHRNIANVVSPDDLSSLAALDFAVGVLRVRHVIVCGHYGCGGVQAVVEGNSRGPIAEWLAPIDSIQDRHSAALNALDTQGRLDLLCELNVAYQVLNVASSSPVAGAWEEGRELCVHGWMYDIESGRLLDLELTASEPKTAVEAVWAVVARRLALHSDSVRSDGV